MDKRAVRLSVRGRVQGVGFRYSAMSTARRLGLTGWVRNEYDGSVAVVCEGTASGVDAFIRWCRKGPPMARVTEVVVKEAALQGVYRQFTIE